jgi:RNA polymerase sigma factor (sigma-70 family)
MVTLSCVHRLYLYMDRRAARLLLDRIRAGDAEAFARAYEAYRARLYNFLARMTARPAVAEELLQETWTKLAKNAWRLAEDTDLGAWLFTVARNLARDYRRSERGSRDAGMDWRDARETVSETMSPEASPFEHAAASETETRLSRAIAALKPEDREVLLLVAVEGMSQDQVAKVLGIGHEASRQRVARARARLLVLLEPSVVRSGSNPSPQEEFGHVRH